MVLVASGITILSRDSQFLNASFPIDGSSLEILKSVSPAHSANVPSPIPSLLSHVALSRLVQP